jgi:hypothetical protein
VTFDRARHFLQDDRGPDLAAAIVEFLKRRLPANREANRAWMSPA